MLKSIGVTLAVATGLVLLGPAKTLYAYQVQACPDVAASAGNAGAVEAHVRYLSDDALEGREVGTRGARCAADYIAHQLEAIGLEGAGRDGSYFQSFPVRAGSLLGEQNTLRDAGISYPVGSEWIPLGYSASTSITAELIYGGDGINRPLDPDNEYPKLDIDGRIVVVEEGDLRFSSSRALQADTHFKASVAAGRGAGALLVLLREDRELPELFTETRSALRIPVAALAGDAAASIRRAARSGGTATLMTSVRPRAVEARNVVAFLPGADPDLAREVVIVGAHYDHLGLGGEGSLEPDAVGVVHNGADDNASGTSGLIEVAHRLAMGDREPARSILFLAFTGEEKGLWGSATYVREPLVPLDRTVAMLNMDMIGRLEGRPLMVMGVGTAEEWLEVLETANGELTRPLTLATAPDGFGPSDHASFYGEGIPVLHFFSNTHEDYHRPSDDWEKIDGDGLRQIVDLVTELTLDLAGEEGTARRVAITPIQASEVAAHGQTSSNTSGGYGPYLGTIPDMIPTDFGLRLSGVREGSPADIAGLMRGDIVVAFAGKEIGDIYAYTYALQEHEAGDEVEIVVMRDGERVSVTAVLGDRR